MQHSIDANAPHRQLRCHWMAMKPMVDVTMMVLLVWPNRHPLPSKHFVWNALKNYRFVPQSISVCLPFSTLGQLSASVRGFALHVKINGKCTNSVHFYLFFLHWIFFSFTPTSPHNFPLYQCVPPSNIFIFSFFSRFGMKFTWVAWHRLHFRSQNLFSIFLQSKCVVAVWISTIFYYYRIVGRKRVVNDANANIFTGALKHWTRRHIATETVPARNSLEIV